MKALFLKFATFVGIVVIGNYIHRILAIVLDTAADKIKPKKPPTT